MPRLRPHGQKGSAPVIYLPAGNWICSSGWDSENKMGRLEMSFLRTYLSHILETNSIKVRAVVCDWRGWPWVRAVVWDWRGWPWLWPFVVGSCNCFWVSRGTTTRDMEQAAETRCPGQAVVWRATVPGLTAGVS